MGYLKDARQRSNLTIKTGCHISRLLIDNQRAVGVEIYQDGKPQRLHASREVIVSAGAIGSPKLLQLSGIGAADELSKKAFRWSPISGRRGKPAGPSGYRPDLELGNALSYDKYKKTHWMLWAGLEYLLFRKGPVCSNIVEGGAFWYADKQSVNPDTQIHFLAGAGVEAGIEPVPSGPA